jgi:hypothetical protein
MSDETEVLDTQVEEVAPEAVEVETPVEKTMDDTIRETLHKINARESETDEQKADRLRDEKGRFAKDAAQVQTPEATTPAEAKPEPVAPTVPPDLQRLGLRKEEAEAIAANPVALQAFMRRSEEMHKGLEQYRQKAQFADQMAQAIQPYAQTIQSMGMHPAQAVQKLMEADRVMRNGTAEQKQAAAMHILQGYGIQIGEGQQPYVDQNLSAVQQQLQQMHGWILQRNQQEQQRQEASLNSEIAAFRQDPANKYFEHVAGDMAGLLQAGIASTLKDAYERAIYANPTVRTQLLAEQQAQSEATRKAEALQRAQEAKKASAINVQKRGTIPARKPLGSMEDTIREKAREMGLIS